MGTLKEKFIKIEKYKQWLISEITELHPHNIHHRQTGFELFTKEGKNFIFNVYESSILKDIFQLFKILNPKISCNLNKQEAFKQSGLQSKWINGEITNFEYLMALNTYAGRSLNNLSQYPIFPWILKDYHSLFLDLTDPDSYRDLHLPVGALAPQRLNSFMERYKNLNIKNDNMKPFIYGTHYSNPPSILFYMIRLEPFSSLSTQLQNGKFDCADRLFSSIPECWDSCMTNYTDLKELIPEFFYFPEFLKNKWDFFNLFNLLMRNKISLNIFNN